MLSDILEDSPTVKVLDFLLDEPELDYSKTDLARECKMTWLTVNKVVDRLEKFGILARSRTINRAVMYKLNDASPIFSSLKNVDMLLSDIVYQEIQDNQPEN
ncbi:Uncharacterised protein [uncultured archaeon]|nr:Uncharacterised protein [uncultured archaeon]